MLSRESGGSGLQFTGGLRLQLVALAWHAIHIVALRGPCFSPDFALTFPALFFSDSRATVTTPPAAWWNPLPTLPRSF